jgi:uncharacterized protein YbaP (TraB family)
VSRQTRAWRAGLAALAVLAFAGAAAAAPPVWVVRDADSELVLFGSVHVLPQGLDWAPPALTAALKTADDLWFELPIDPASEAETSQLANANGLLAPDQSLNRILGPADSARMAKLAQAYDVSPLVLDHLKPWLAEIALAAGQYRKAGATAASGVEEAISALAPQARRDAFETPAEQIGLLSGGAQEEQLQSLRETMQEMEDKPDEYQLLLKAWVDGDLAALTREALEPMKKTTPDLFRRMVTDRNARWTRVLDARLKGHGRTVVVVGVGHLLGPDGVPARLRALGYSVSGP